MQSPFGALPEMTAEQEKLVLLGRQLGYSEAANAVGDVLLKHLFSDQTVHDALMEALKVINGLAGRP